MSEFLDHSGLITYTTKIKKYIKALFVEANESNASVPVGAVFYIASTTIPSGYLVCDGSAIDRTTYSKLFSVIGTSFGAGNGSTTFNIPDLRAKFIRSSGTSDGYSATFAVTQDATYIGNYTNGSTLTSGTLPLPMGNADKGVSISGSKFDVRGAASNTSARNYYIRPYNISLTGIIKY